MIKRLVILLLSTGYMGMPGFAQVEHDATISIYFNFGKDIPANEESQRVGSVLSQIKFRVVKLSGFADSVGSKEESGRKHTGQPN